jgi:asparagine synthase (glutamine-hydrolysing)
LIQLDRPERIRLYAPWLRERLGAGTAEQTIARRWAESSATDPLDRMLDVDVGLYLPDDLLAKVDIATMAHSLEARSPLLDPELMQFAAGLPARLKVSGGEKKVALRSALRGWVPDAILDAPKQGFAVPLAQWLREDLKDLAYDTLLDPRARDRGLFEPAAVRALLDRHAFGLADHSQAIWTLLVLERWLQDHGEASPPAGAAGRAGYSLRA